MNGYSISSSLKSLENQLSKCANKARWHNTFEDFFTRFENHQSTSFNNFTSEQVGPIRKIDYRHDISGDHFQISIGLGVAKWNHTFRDYDLGNTINTHFKRSSKASRTTVKQSATFQMKTVLEQAHFFTMTIGDYLKYYYKTRTEIKDTAINKKHQELLKKIIRTDLDCSDGPNPSLIKNWHGYYNGNIGLYTNIDNLRLRKFVPNGPFVWEKSSNLTQFLSNILIFNIKCNKNDQLSKLLEPELIRLFTNFDCKMLPLRLLNDFRPLDEPSITMKEIIYYSAPKKFIDIMDELYKITGLESYNRTSKLISKPGNARQELELEHKFKPIILTSFRSYMDSTKESTNKSGTYASPHSFRNLYLTQWDPLSDERLLSDIDRPQFLPHNAKKFKHMRDIDSKLISTRKHYEWGTKKHHRKYGQILHERKQFRQDYIKNDPKESELEKDNIMEIKLDENVPQDIEKDIIIPRPLQNFSSDLESNVDDTLKYYSNEFPPLNVCKV